MDLLNLKMNLQFWNKPTKQLVFKVLAFWKQPCSAVVCQWEGVLSRIFCWADGQTVWQCQLLCGSLHQLCSYSFVVALVSEGFLHNTNNSLQALQWRRWTQESCKFFCCWTLSYWTTSYLLSDCPGSSPRSPSYSLDTSTKANKWFNTLNIAKRM